MRPNVIISGGQAGADKGGLIGARDCGITTGGTAPKGWRTENGCDYTLRHFGLTEGDASSYIARTEMNVANSDGTAMFGDWKSPGSRRTIEACDRMGRPYTLNPSAEQLRAWVRFNEIECLNIAGNRESRNPGIQERVRQIVVEAFGPDVWPLDQRDDPA